MTGPPCLPIIGTFRLTKKMHILFDEWAKKYGQQYYVDMIGMRYVEKLELLPEICKEAYVACLLKSLKI